MFNYFGSKRKIAHFYPMPRYAKIIEPFAGSAAYSVLHKPAQCHINDYSPVIATIWQWIIQAENADIEGLPDMKKGEYVTSYNLSVPQRLLMGFSVNCGRATSGNIYQGWAAKNNDIAKMKKRLYDNCPLIRHWQVTNTDYKQIPNEEATWFIDPPYQEQGSNYTHHKIDYTHLAEWCKTRQGQVIVCEAQADWLPFQILCRTYAKLKWQTESIWKKM